MYEKAIVTFIDILGFKDLVSKSPAGEVWKQMRLFEHFSKPESGIEANESELTVLQFSDSIVRVRPIESPLNKAGPYGIAFQEIIDLVHLQGELVDYGIFVRGGVSFGEVYAKEGKIFGPAFIRAYELESIYARMPRIVVDTAFLKAIESEPLLRSTVHDAEEERQLISKLLHRETDGTYHIDYLKAFLNEVNFPEDGPMFLRRHKDVILANGKAAEELSSKALKYLWLALYHNRVVEETRQKKSLRISPREMPGLLSR